MLKKIIWTLFFVPAQAVFSQTTELKLNLETATKLAEVPLDCIQLEFPNKLNQVLTDSSELLTPEKLHPIFYGCFDWHSSVHGHWLLATVMNHFHESSIEAQISAVFDQQFTKEKVNGELAYFEPKLNKSFERTYGWAWYLKLHAELLASPLNEEHQWTATLQPLTDYFVGAYKSFLPKLLYPIRVGEHTNTAFGLSLALDYARELKDEELEALITQKSLEYYKEDKGCPLGWEPSGFDFISPCLQEAELMSKILQPDEFEKWMKQFLPTFFSKKLEIEPGEVMDRTDGKLVHLDGLSFSRAWCLYQIATILPKQRNRLIEIADEHVRTSFDQVIGSDYMGSHWLATFLVYALEKRERLTEQ